MFRFSVFLLLLSCLACTGDDTYVLTARDELIVDSLFKERVTKVREDTDSLCDLRFDALVKHYTDSLVEARTAERKRYLERIQRELQND